MEGDSDENEGKLLQGSKTMNKDFYALNKWVENRWKWYVLGYYHCDQCPCSWEERNYYEGDADAGCYIKGDIQDTCRLIEPFRSLICWYKKRRYEYWEDHQYDGYEKYWDEIIQRELAFEECLEIFMKNKEVYIRDFKGRMIPVCKKELRQTFPYGFDEALRHYEDKAHPFQPAPKLKTRWKHLLKDTWKECVYNKVVPYLPRKRRKRNDNR